MPRLTSLLIAFAITVGGVDGLNLRTPEEDALESPLHRILHYGWGQPNIIDTAKSAGLTTLVELVEMAGLVETLEGAGPFTVVSNRPNGQVCQGV